MLQAKVLDKYNFDMVDSHPQGTSLDRPTDRHCNPRSHAANVGNN